MGFIRKLYLNDIEIQKIHPDYEGTLKDLADQIDTTYKQLIESLSNAHKTQFQKYADLVEKFMDDSLLARFENGFRLGGQCVHDVFMGNKEAAHEEKWQYHSSSEQVRGLS